MTYVESRSKVLDIIKQTKEAHDVKYPTRSSDSERSLVEMVKARCRAASETAYEYTQIMDVLVGQAPEHVALAYGAVKLLLVVQVNYEAMKKNVEDHLVIIKTKFFMTDHLTTYFPSGKLVKTIGRMYERFQMFLAKALKFYTRSRFANTFRALTKPWKELETVVQSIEQTYEEIRDIIHFSNHLTGQVILAKVSKMLELIEGESIRFSKPRDIEQTSDLFRQRIEAKIEQHSVEVPQKTKDNIRSKTEERSLDDLLNLDQQMATLFTDLNEFDEASAQQQRITEQLPEMRQFLAYHH
ncbi:hypothetical protein GGS24DRAFT_77310 [Hypoxylon argillaceum]|nr:hypothetical protein GGS24DRAFT_77310 [Hypoxylon argillaceum]